MHRLEQAGVRTGKPSTLSGWRWPGIGLTCEDWATIGLYDSPLPFNAVPAIAPSRDEFKMVDTRR
jgi:hypothetical protein